MKHFYSHLVEIESVIVILEELDLSPSQKNHLATLIDSSFYHLVLDISLSHLDDPSDKYLFVQILSEDSADPRLMEILISKGEDIEEKLRKAVSELKDEIHQELKQAKLIKATHSKKK